MTTNDNGVLAQIRHYLDMGLASRDIVAKGFNPSSVYKEQRRWRKRQAALDRSDHEAGDGMDSEELNQAIVDLSSRVNGLAETYQSLRGFFDRNGERLSFVRQDAAELRRIAGGLADKLGALEGRVEELRRLVDAHVNCRRCGQPHALHRWNTPHRCYTCPGSENRPW
ncbi:MAG: hypothetical protein FJ312_08560 [SAR202 cluster bacterium]|nr:hypothetical protein [SAR202 cluster bacterium]